MQPLIPGDIESALDDLGIEYRVSGDQASACCPFHEETHPSWGVNLSSGLHHCFTCGAKGNFSQLVIHITGKDRLGAAEWIAVRHATVPMPTSRVRKPVSDDTTKQMNDAKLALFDEPPFWACKVHGISPGIVDELGILWDSKHDNWIIPIRDPKTSELWGWQEKGETSRFFRNYPEHVRKSRTLFAIQDVVDDDAPCYLVESPIDVAVLRSAGFRGAVSSYGSGVSSRQLDILISHTSRLIVCLDNDKAGRASSLRIARDLHLIPCWFFNYKGIDAKDPGEMTNAQISQGIRNKIGQFSYAHPPAA